MANILLVEDENNIRTIIAYDLRKASHTVVECKDGKEGLQQGLSQEFDVMIIDWMLPFHSGIELIQTFRSKGIQSIIIMLTARDDESDILYAFDQGIDDYITKPFSPRELLARVNAHLKRHQKKANEAMIIGDIEIDMKRREVRQKTRVISLTKKEFDLLEYFVRNQGIIVSRDEILNDIWGFDYDGDTRIVDVHIFKLRSKLEYTLLSFKSSRGVGYLLEIEHAH